MKQLLLILIILIPGKLLLNAQVVHKERKVVQVLPPQTFFLNSWTGGTISGRSTTTYNISLPKNTVEWYYSFTTTREEKPKAGIGLLSQLSKLYDPLGLSKVATSAVLTPSGAGVCDIFLMDKDNCKKFNKRLNQLRGSYDYIENNSRENFSSGTVHVTDKTSGNWCLGFKNPSATEGTSITFEVVAIVEEEQTLKKTDAQLKAETFASLGRNSFEKEEYDKALELSKKALELNPELGAAHASIGLVQLVNKDYMSAIYSYTTAIIHFNRSADPVGQINESIKQVDALKAKRGDLEGINDVQDLLKKALEGSPTATN